MTVPVETSGNVIGLEIELPYGNLAKILAPRFRVADRLIWTPLPGEEEDSSEGGIVIGMRWAPVLSETSMLGQGSEGEWEYLIYLDKNSPSRALGVYSDWAAEPDLMIRGQLQPQPECADLQGEP